MAIKWGYANLNPLRNVEPIRVMSKTEARFLTKEEIDKLLANSNEWLRPIFYSFLQTGMRLQELMTLEWSDIDFDRRKIKIRVKEDWTPKTSEREIPISNGLLEVLLKLKKAAIGTYGFP
jgi:integrase